MRPNEHSPSKETANQAIPFAEEPTTTSQKQEEIYSSEEEISEPRKTASRRTVRRPQSAFQGLCYVTMNTSYILTFDETVGPLY